MIAKICPSGSLFVITWHASWCQSVILGMDLLSQPHTHDRFLYSCEDGIAKKNLSLGITVITWHAWWCQSVILGTDFSILPSHSWWILIFLWGWDSKNLSLRITDFHHSASLVMAIGDPWEGFFYPTFTLMIDSYITYPSGYPTHPNMGLVAKNLCWGSRQSEIQTSLLSYRDKLENWNFAHSKPRYVTFQ